MPHGFDGCATLDLEALRAAGERVNGALHGVGADADGDHPFWLQQGAKTLPAAFVVPIDDHFALRVQTMQRFHRWMNRRPTGALPRQLRLSAYQRHRLTLMLRAWDGTETGASRRKVAGVLLNKDVLTMRAIDWKNAPERRRLNRLLSSTRELINGGYLRLLQGAAARIHLFGRR